MAAGNKDLKILGDKENKSESYLNDIPKFTPFNCNFFKQTISATEQNDKLLAGKSGKDAPRLTCDKIHPIYDKARFKHYITKSNDQKFMANYKMSETQNLLSEMQKASHKLLYSGDHETGDKKHEAEKEAIIRGFLMKQVEEGEAKGKGEEAAKELIDLKHTLRKQRRKSTGDSSEGITAEGKSVKSILKPSTSQRVSLPSSATKGKESGAHRRSQTTLVTGRK